MVHFPSAIVHLIAAVRRCRRHDVCLSDRMAVREFRDLACWQLAYALKSEIFAFTATLPASRDFKFRDQIRDSSASAPRNIAEGFGRLTPREFVRFLGYARGSIVETQNHLIDARDRGYIDEALFKRLFNLASAARRTTTRLMMSKQPACGEPHSHVTRPPKGTR